MDILVIDDEQDIGDILRDLLEGEGYKVGYAPEAETALRILATAQPCVLICDITMPGKNGIQLLEDLKLAGNIQAVVMLTAHAESEMVVKALQLGAIDYLVKPFDTGELVAKVPGWMEVGRRLQEVAGADIIKPEVLRRQLHMIDLFRLKNRRLSKQA